MSTWREDLTLLRDRRFALLLGARTISALGSAFAPVALAFGVLGIEGATETTLSIVLAAESIPMIVFMLVGGVIADRFPRNRVMMTGELMSATAFAAIAAMLFTGWTPLWALGTAAAFSGVGMAILWPAITGIIPEVVPAEHLQQGNAMLSLGVNTSRVLGVVASGVVVAAFGGAWSLAVSGGFFLLAALLISHLTSSTSRTGQQVNAGSVFRDLREGWREFVSHQWLWVVVAQFSLLVMCFSGAHGVLGPVLAKAELGGARAWSWVLAGESAGMIVGVMVAMRLKPKHPILLPVLLCIPTVPLPFILLGVGAPLWTIVASAFFMGIAFDVFGVMWNTTMQREVPPESLSRVSSYDALGSMMFGPIGLLIAGPFAAWVGVHTAMVGTGIALVLITASALLSPSVRTLTWRETPVSGSEDDVPAIPTPAENLS